MRHHRLQSFGTAWSALRSREVCVLHTHLCLVSKSSSVPAPLVLLGGLASDAVSSSWDTVSQTLATGGTLTVSSYCFPSKEQNLEKRADTQTGPFPRTSATLRKMPPQSSLQEKACTGYLSFYLLCSVLHNCKDVTPELLSTQSHCWFTIALCPESRVRTLQVTRQLSSVRTKCIV